MTCCAELTVCSLIFSLYLIISGRWLLPFPLGPSHTQRKPEGALDSPHMGRSRKKWVRGALRDDKEARRRRGPQRCATKALEEPQSPFNAAKRLQINV